MQVDDARAPLEGMVADGPERVREVHLGDVGAATVRPVRDLDGPCRHHEDHHADRCSLEGAAEALPAQNPRSSRERWQAPSRFSALSAAFTTRRRLVHGAVLLLLARLGRVGQGRPGSAQCLDRHVFRQLFAGRGGGRRPQTRFHSALAAGNGLLQRAWHCLAPSRRQPCGRGRGRGREVHPAWFPCGARELTPRRHVNLAGLLRHACEHTPTPGSRPDGCPKPRVRPQVGAPVVHLAVRMHAFSV